MASASSPLLFLLFLVLAFLPLSTIAQASGNVTLGHSLSAGGKSSWVSPSGDFALGFRKTGEKDQFYLAVWYDRIPENTVIWTAAEKDTGQPVLVQKGSKLELRADGLSLTDPQNKETWAAKTSDGTVASAAMLDTGNFVLRNSISTITWQSFDTPTDTILPTQILGMNQKLISHATETNFSSGRFELRLQDGNLVLFTVAPISRNTYTDYWSIRTDGDRSQLLYNETGTVYLKLGNGTVFYVTAEDMGSYPAGEFYQRVRLDFDGVLRQYLRPKPGRQNGTWSQNWTRMKSVPDNICVLITGVVGSGACGYNSYCVLDDNSMPSCHCPTSSYSYIDPSNPFAGCEPNFTLQSCEMDGGLEDEEPQYDMVDMMHMDWPYFDFEYDTNVTENTCRQACLDDCLCAVAIYRGGECWKKNLPLSYGRLDTSFAGKALIKVPRSNSPRLVPRQPQGLGRQNNNQRTLVLMMSVLFGSSAFLNLLLLSVTLFAIYFSNAKKQVKLDPCSRLAGINLRSFTYKELEEITDGFKEELGGGSCGTVYKGVLPSDAVNFVAVKKIDRMAEEAEKEFRNEVSAIARIHHKNLVQLLGFCEEGLQRLLVYEFMSNGSLASFLFSDSRPQWHQRTHIAFGIARGLTYLHEECNNQIIHCDIKPQNILLDDSFRARISDFGLAKLLKTDQTRTTTGIRGTRGYVAPEWFRDMAITAKVDVYSFGVMLLEIICCRRNVNLEIGDGEEAILTDWAYDCYRVGQIARLVEGDREALNDARKLERMVMVAIWCIQEDPSFRPTMTKVSQMLEGAIDVAVPPNPVSFISSLA